MRLPHSHVRVTRIKKRVRVSQVAFELYRMYVRALFSPYFKLFYWMTTQSFHILSAAYAQSCQLHNHQSIYVRMHNHLK